MLNHKEVWRAIDRLAEAKGLSVSGLAKKSGLDATAFNKSKRQYADGKLRWPSTESISRILKATETRIGEFSAYLDGGNEPVTRVPLIGFAQAGTGGYFDDAGYPLGVGWDEITFPDIRQPNIYALEINGNSMDPVYREGDRIIVSPASSVRRGDRVIVKATDGRVLAKELIRSTASRVELRALNVAYDDLEIARRDIEWIARILWASQ